MSKPKQPVTAGLKIDPAAFGAKSSAPVAPANLDRTPSVDTKPVQIRVPVEKHTEIKAYAAEQQMSITDLLLMAYEEYRQRHK